MIVFAKDRNFCGNRVLMSYEIYTEPIMLTVREIKSEPKQIYKISCASRTSSGIKGPMKGNKPTNHRIYMVKYQKITTCNTTLHPCLLAYPIRKIGHLLPPDPWN